MIPKTRKCDHGQRPMDCLECLQVWANHMEDRRRIDERFRVIEALLTDRKINLQGEARP